MIHLDQAEAALETSIANEPTTPGCILRLEHAVGCIIRHLRSDEQARSAAPETARDARKEPVTFPDGSVDHASTLANEKEPADHVPPDDLTLAQLVERAEDLVRKIDRGYLADASLTAREIMQALRTRAAPETTGAIGVVCSACGREIFVAGHECEAAEPKEKPGAEAGTGESPTDEDLMAIVREQARRDLGSAAPCLSPYPCTPSERRALFNAGREYGEENSAERIEGLWALLPIDLPWCEACSGSGGFGSLCSKCRGVGRLPRREEPAKGGAGEG